MGRPIQSVSKMPRCVPIALSIFIVVSLTVGCGDKPVDTPERSSTEDSGAVDTISANPDSVNSDSMKTALSGEAFSDEEGIDPCTTEWYAWVEEKVNTGDGAGHGPDIGSSEWKYSVLFKIGAEGKAGTPSPDSDAWCSFVDSALKAD